MRNISYSRHIMALWGRGSCSSPHAKLLSNPVAYEVLETIYIEMPPTVGGGPAIDNPANTLPMLYAYQCWLHKRLPQSGLAKALAAGADFLPDITAELDQPWRYLARLFAPRNYHQLTLQVVRNLAWYLGAECKPLTPIHRLKSSLGLSLFATALAFWPLALNTSILQQPWPVILFTIILLEAAILATVMCWSQDAAGRHSANCAELYAYLLAAYAEPGVDEENRVRSLLKEMGRDPNFKLEVIKDRPFRYRW
jgi:hypothetical protein